MKKLQHFLFLIAFFLVFTVVATAGVYMVAKHQLDESNKYITDNQLTYTLSMLDQKSKEVEMIATSLAYDERVRNLANKYDSSLNENPENTPVDDYDRVMEIKYIKEKMKNLKNDSIGVKSISIYWAKIPLVLSTTTIQTFEGWLPQLHTVGRNWSNNQESIYFSTSYPYIEHEVQNNQAVEYYVAIELENDYIRNLSQSAETSTESHVLLVLPDGKVYNKEKDDAYKKAYLANQNKEQVNVTINNQQYQMRSKKSEFNQLRIVNFYDTTESSKTISRLTLLTAGLTILIVLLGGVLMILFYRGVLYQLGILTKHFKQIENGNLDVQIDYESKNEFNYVFEQFNQMAKGIRRLLASLKNEHEKRGIAENKQLQSQINPHFLYNSLFYIVSVADNPKAVRQMAKHLGDYYRYRTKSQEVVSIEDELNFAKSYLEIMSLRKSIQYTIDSDEESLDRYIIPLVIQPLIENAIYHGIEGSTDAHQIIVSVHTHDDTTLISVEDDGKGLTEAECAKLSLQLNQLTNARDSIGLWNCNQRLRNYYGPESRLTIGQSELLGGLCVSFEIKGDR